MLRSRAHLACHTNATMDTAPGPYEPSSSTSALPYDDTVPYEDQVSAAPDVFEPSDSGRSLADRIGTTKVYLLSDASKSRVGKVRWQHVL